MRATALARISRAALVAALVAVLVPGSPLVAKAAPPPASPAFSVGDVTVTEGASGTTAATFTVTLSSAVTAASSVKYGTANGTAVAGSDYVATSGVLNFPAGDTSKTFTVQVNGDVFFEPTETFVVNLSRARGAKLGDKAGTGTITNDDASPAFSIGDVSVVEGNSGTTSAVFPVTLTASGPAALTVAYETVEGTASAADFTATTGTLTFQPGDISEPIAVPVKGDILDEPDQTFMVSLSSPVGATITDGEATGTITDDDDSPRASISDAVGAEPADGEANDAVFTVSLSAPSEQLVSIDYSTTGDTAVENTDYTATSATVNIPAGETQASISVPLTFDDISEVPNEHFTVTLANPSNASLHDATGQGTILDFDALPAITASSVEVQEGNEGSPTASVVVSLSIASSEQVTVDYTTADGTALAGQDYSSTSGPVTFAAGERSKNVDVDIIGDLVDELDEELALNLSNPNGGAATVLAGNESTPITIADDDATPLLSIGDVNIVEGDAGTAVATFTVTASGVSDRVMSAAYALENGTAAGASDFVATGGTVTIPAGQTSDTIDVPVIGDKVDEPNETYFVQLSNFQNGVGGDDRGAGTITDNDKSSTVTGLKVRKRPARMIVKGTLRKPRPGQKMVVKLFKRRGAKWALVTTKRPALSAAKDVNGDGRLESTFSARFRRPSTAKLFRIVTRYAGDADNLPSKAMRKVRYRA